MKVVALRGVCIGVDRHLVPGETVDLDAAQVQFLTSIGAVERVPDAPPLAEPQIELIAPAEPGKKGK